MCSYNIQLSTVALGEKNNVSVKVTGRSSGRVRGKVRVGLELELWLG